MTEKRFKGFTSSIDYYIVEDTLENRYLSKEDVINALNKFWIQYEHYEKENNELKQTIKGAYEILSINVDVFSDKSLEQDSIAYKELQQLDNKDAYSIVRGIKGTIVLLKKRL